jgi:diguanylate cyclase (GGDEF)-like protein
MYDRMKELAIIDELTGIYNRRFFYIAANKEITRSVRYKKDLSFILIDIDHYKEVNDHYGHLAGDKVLQRITQVIQKELRTSDVFARYGGEEFLILLSDTPGMPHLRWQSVSGRRLQPCECIMMKRNIRYD